MAVEKIVGHRRQVRERAGAVEWVITEIVATYASDDPAPDAVPSKVAERAAGVRHLRSLELPQELPE